MFDDILPNLLDIDLLIRLEMQTGHNHLSLTSCLCKRQAEKCFASTNTVVNEQALSKFNFQIPRTYFSMFFLCTLTTLKQKRQQIRPLSSRSSVFSDDANNICTSSSHRRAANTTITHYFIQFSVSKMKIRKLKCIYIIKQKCHQQREIRHH